MDVAACAKQSQTPRTPEHTRCALHLLVTQARDTQTPVLVCPAHSTTCRKRHTQSTTSTHERCNDTCSRSGAAHGAATKAQQCSCTVDCTLPTHDVAQRGCACQATSRIKQHTFHVACHTKLGKYILGRSLRRHCHRCHGSIVKQLQKQSRCRS